MTSQPEGTKPGVPAFSPSNGKERVLVFIVVLLGLLILAGLAAIVGRIIYLSSAGTSQPADAEGQVAGVAAVTPDRLDLPPGAEVKSVSVSGDRLAVHYDAPTGAAIAVVDLTTGMVLRRVDIVPGGEAR